MVEKIRMQDYRLELYSRYASTQQKFNYDFLSKKQLAWYRHKFPSIFLNLNPNSSILDLGCGQGHFMEFLKTEGFLNVEGIDISKEQVDIANSRGINAQIADAITFLQSKKESYDAIIALDVIEHFRKDELLVLFNEIHNSLRNDGELIIQTPNGSGLFPNQVIYGDLTQLTIFTPGSLEQLLRITGFGDIKFFETGPFQVDITGSFRLLLWKIIKLVVNLIRLIEVGKQQDIWTANMICY